MPFKDPERRRQYNAEYNRTHKRDRAEYHKLYREVNREEIAENKLRCLRVSAGHGQSLYIGTVGMTRKQREKYQKELNDHGETIRP